MTTIEDFDQFYQKYKENENNNAHPIEDIKFWTDIGKEIPFVRKTNFASSIDRPGTIAKINQILQDIEISTLLEASCFEASLVYAQLNNIEEVLLPAIYGHKLGDVIFNLGDSTKFKTSVLSKAFDPQKVSFLSPDELRPENWKDLIAKEELRQYKKANMAVTILYKCRKCGQRKHTIAFLQTRSADEPMTEFVTCMNCGNTFRK